MLIVYRPHAWHGQPFYIKFAISFAIFYTVLLIFCRYSFSHDPTSRFFNDATAYLPRYSAQREQASLAFIDRASTEEQVKFNTNLRQPKLCVGVASVARKGSRYFRQSVGSLLADLDQSERERIHLTLFIPHTDPTLHPAYRDGWMPHVADTVLTYNLTEEQQAHIKALEDEPGSLFREKGLFDYVYLLKSCQTTGSQYVAIIEDDTLALDGWYHRTTKALHTAEFQTYHKPDRKFLYLRLFYTEEYFGWNSESWPSYLFWSTLIAGLVYLGLMTCRRATAHTHPSAKEAFAQRMIYAYTFIYLPLLIILFFAAGRHSLLPLPRGVHEMANYGCCSQGLVFQQSRLPDIIEYLEGRQVGFVDQLLEEYAAESNDLRLALTPSVLQHVGSRSSKGDGENEPIKHNRSGAGIIFNFAFEDNDPVKLHNEHMKVLSDGSRSRTGHAT